MWRLIGSDLLVWHFDIAFIRVVVASLYRIILWERHCYQNLFGRGYSFSAFMSNLIEPDKNLLVQVTTIGNQARGYSLITIFYGISAIFGPPIGGWLGGKMHNMPYAFLPCAIR